ncbi:MAG TPA: hypothetical protein VFS21_20245 [Roseiflexaceae bacterium]|nr:hypothetical protein [Roseiflexaceae bacterium]
MLDDRIANGALVDQRGQAFALGDRRPLAALDRFSQRRCEVISLQDRICAAQQRGPMLEDQLCQHRVRDGALWGHLWRLVQIVGHLAGLTRPADRFLHVAERGLHRSIVISRCQVGLLEGR